VPDEPRQERHAVVMAMHVLSHSSPTVCLLPIIRARLAIIAGVVGPV
jgi:hypothetical protein